LGKGFDYLDFTQKNKIIAGAGCSLSKFVIGTAYEGYDFSDFSGIPGSLGGSVRGNSGSMQRGICDFIEEIKIVANDDKNIIEKTLRLNKSDFGYRYLNIMNLIAITGIVFTAQKFDKEDILKKVADKMKEKRRTQPISSRSAGCFFKNINGYDKSTGQLIEECGLKGFIYGGARISKKHANFIENFKNASSQDIFVLSKIVKEIAMSKFNKKLEYEVKLVGF
jgi:UDP-N-acetylmuramate dehydrogenase